MLSLVAFPLDMLWNMLCYVILRYVNVKVLLRILNSIQRVWSCLFTFRRGGGYVDQGGGGESSRLEPRQRVVCWKVSATMSMIKVINIIRMTRMTRMIKIIKIIMSDNQREQIKELSGNGVSEDLCKGQGWKGQQCWCWNWCNKDKMIKTTQDDQNNQTDQRDQSDQNLK